MDSKENKTSKQPLKETCSNVDLNLNSVKSNQSHQDQSNSYSEVMNEILKKSQHLHNQYNCLKDLLKVYSNCNYSEFFQQFVLKVKFLLQQDYKNCFVKNCIIFLSRFIITVDNESKQIDISNINEDLNPCEVTLTQSVSEKSTFLDQLISKFLINHLESSLVDLRYNICFLLSKIFQEVTDISDEIYSFIISALTNRMTDRNNEVRAMATLALRRFQDPKDSKDQVMIAYHFHLRKDPSHKVRLNVLSCIEPCDSTISEIVNKTRDVQAIIRKAAYVKLSTLDSNNLLTNEQRLALLKDGFNDPNTFVRKVVENRLILGWLKLYQDNIFTFLENFDIQKETDVLEKTVEVILKQYLIQRDVDFGTKLHSLIFNFRQKYLDEKKLILVQHFNIRKIFLWRLLNCFIKKNEVSFLKNCQFESNCKKQKNENLEHLNCSTSVDNQEFEFSLLDSSAHVEEMTETLLPEFPHFCNFIQKFINKNDTDDVGEASLIESEFIFDQLLKFLSFYDVGDDAQKFTLLKVIKSILLSNFMFLKFENCISPAIYLASSKIYKNSQKLLEFVADISNQVYDDVVNIENEQKCSSPTIDATVMEKWEMDYALVVMDLEEHKDLMDRALADQDYSKAHDLKLKLNELDLKKRTMMQKRLDLSLFIENQTLSEDTVNPIQFNQPFDLSQRPEALLKCLQIFIGCLEFGYFNNVNGIILTHIERVSLPGVLSSEPKIRKLAVKSLGLSCLLSSNLFQRYYNLFLQIIKHDEEDVKIVGLQGLLDSLCKHGIAALIEPGSENTSENNKLNSSQNSSSSEQNRIINSIIEFLLDLTLNSEFDSIKKLAVEGIAKMMVCGTISSHLLSRLIIIWYLPDTSSIITQFLEFFISRFVYSETKYSNQNDDSIITGQTCLIESILETLEMIYKARIEMKKNLKNFESIKHFQSLGDPRKLAHIDIKHMLSFLSNLLNKDYHSLFFTLLCQKILNILSSTSFSLSKIEESENNLANIELLMEYFLKICPNLDLASVETSKKIELINLVNSIISQIKLFDSNKTIKKKIDQFVKYCQGLIRKLQTNNDKQIVETKNKKRVNDIQDNDENYYQEEIDNQSDEEENEEE